MIVICFSVTIWTTKTISNESESEFVSIDFNTDPHSSIADITQTQVLGSRFVRILAWYDNEWGFSNRMLDTAVLMMRTS